MIDYLTSLPKDTLAYALILALFAGLVQIVLQAWKNRGQKEITQLTLQDSLLKHNSTVSIELIEKLREELKRVSEELDKEREAHERTSAALSSVIKQVKEITDLLEDILCAVNDNERDTAEDAARLYLAT